MPTYITTLLTRKTVAIANLDKKILWLENDYENLQRKLSVRKHKTPEDYKNLFILEGNITQLVNVLYDLKSMDDALSAKSFKINVSKINQLEVAAILNSCFHSDFGTDLLKQSNQLPDSLLSEKDHDALDLKEKNAHIESYRRIALLKSDAPKFQNVKPTKRAREFEVTPCPQLLKPVTVLSSMLLLKKTMELPADYQPTINTNPIKLNLA